MVKKNLPPCPVEVALCMISNKWKVLIIRELLDGTRRFGELKKSTGGITQKVLTANLRSMEEDGLVTRKIYAEVPPRVEYSLTERGYTLKPILDAMYRWGSEYVLGMTIGERGDRTCPLREVKVMFLEMPEKSPT